MTLIDNFTDEEFINIYNTSESIADMCRKLGYQCASGGNYKTIRKRMIKLNLSEDKFINSHQLQGRKKLELTGQKFGKLTALYRTKKSDHGYYWMCQCDCGKQIEVCGPLLKNGNTRSCGCLKHDIKPKITFPKKDITNQKFGLWTALYRVEDKKGNNGNYYWHCKCDCGTERDVLLSSLTSGKSKSCGCIKSIGETIINQILSNSNIDYFVEYKFPDCLSEKGKPCQFDFAIFHKNKLKCLIEYDGKQHYEDSKFGGLIKNQNRDKIKNEYCLNHNIPLYRIPYFDLESIQNIFDILNDKYLLSSNR